MAEKFRLRALKAPRQDCREEGTLPGHGGPGGYDNPCADRYGAGVDAPQDWWAGADRENGSDGGEGPAPERRRSARVVGPACCRPAYRRGRVVVGCLASVLQKPKKKREKS